MLLVLALCPCISSQDLCWAFGLVEVEPVQVKRHRADAQRGEPDADYSPCTQGSAA